MLRFAVYALFGNTRANLGKHFLHPQTHALPHTYHRDKDLIRGYETDGTRSALSDMRSFSADVRM